MKRLILALVAATALGGCIKMDKTPPKNMPAYVKLYPGSNQVTRRAAWPFRASSPHPGMHPCLIKY